MLTAYTNRRVLKNLKVLLSSTYKHTTNIFVSIVVCPEPASADLISLGPEAMDEARLRALEGCHLSSKALQVLFQSMFCNQEKANRTNLH